MTRALKKATKNDVSRATVEQAQATTGDPYSKRWQYATS
jgi:hypothetical protein